MPRCIEGSRVSALALLAFGISQLLVSSARAEPPVRPNIVFLLADDMRWDAMGCAGNRIIRTPNLDRLAEQGVRFTHAFCVTSICAVNRACIVTGQYESRHHISGFGTPLSREAFTETFPGGLRKAGYRTGFVGKWGLGGKLPEDQFDYWRGFSGQGRYFTPGERDHLDARMARQAVEFIGQSAGQQPFLLCVSFKAPHVQDGDNENPFQPDPRFASLYEDVTVPTPKTADPKYFDLLPEFTRTSEGRVRWQHRFATPELYQRSVKNYYRLVNGIDRAVKQIRAELNKHDLGGRTVIIFTSDNGFFLGEHGLAGKWLMYEESIRVPLIVVDPRLDASRSGTTSDAFALSIDIAPTIMQLAGAEVPGRVQGRSLLPLVQGRPAKWRDELYYEHHYGHRGRIPQTEGVRTDRWKYTRYVASEPIYEELFHLQADPLEERNLARDPSHQQILQRLRERWRVLHEAAR